MKSYIVTWLLV